MRQRPLERQRAVADHFDAVPRLGEMQVEERREVAVIFDDEHGGGGRRQRWGGGGGNRKVGSRARQVVTCL